MRRVLVANRGEIAVRVVRACREEGLEVIVAVSEPDEDSLAARLADDVVHIGPGPPGDSYLRVGQIVAGAILAGCDAVHPGYGFLSERPELAEACAANGLVFVGPPAEIIRRGGDKVAARALAHAAGAPVGDGSGTVRTFDEARRMADRIGYPILLKAVAGGGGRGMARIARAEDLGPSFLVASAEAAAAFGDGRLYLERFVDNARHIEIQVLADGEGTVVHLGDRDCSVQRRYQKLIEEAPALELAPQVRERLTESAVAIVRALGYRSAGTVEFLVDLDSDEVTFLEINTRLQVEHPVTEVVTGVDIVREQLRIAAGAPLSFTQGDVTVTGHAIECRVNAESVGAGFVPSPGAIETWSPPHSTDVRVDSHAYSGYVVPPYYDSLLAKLIVRGPDRGSAVEALGRALDSFAVSGIDTTIGLHRQITAHADFRANRVNTQWLEQVLLPSLDRTHETQGSA